MSVLNYVLNLNGNMLSMLNRVGAASGSTRDDVHNLRTEVEGLNTVNLGGFFSTVGKIASTIGVGAILGKTVKDGMEQEMRNVSFDVLFGGVDNAKQMIDQISDYAAKSPYGKAGLSEATQMMAGFGVAQEKIMPNMKMIGDIAMGNEQKFQSLALVLSQVSSMGYMQGNDKLQFINAGFNPLVELEKMTGKSSAQLNEMMSKGQISIKMIEDALKHATSEGGQFYGMIDKINGTASGQWATALDGISERLLNLYDNVLQPIILPALQSFNVFLDDPIGTIGRLADKITGTYPVLSTLAVGISTLTATIWLSNKAIVAYTTVTKLFTFFKGIETAAWWANNAAMLANPVTWIVAGVVALIAVIAFLIIKVDGWGQMWEHTVNGSKLIFNAFTESVKYYFNTMVDGLMIGLNEIKKGWYDFKEAVGIGDSSENQKMLAQIGADTEARKKAITDGAKNIANLGAQAKNEFSAAINSLSWNDTSFSDVTNGIKNKLGISTPGIPGTDMKPGGVAGGSGGNGSGGSKAGKDTANSIATGGSKTTHITINLGELVGTININKNGFRESTKDMEDQVLDAMTRVLSMSQGQI